MDYVAKAEAAARRWREAQGLPPLDHEAPELSSIPSLSSWWEKGEREAIEGEETDRWIGREGSKERKGDTSLSPYPWQPTYAAPWPDELPGLGPRRVGPFDPCVDCGRGSWARYGGAALCCGCAIARTGGTT
jgi:hypothetical protein